MAVHPIEIPRPYSEHDWEHWCKKIFAKIYGIADFQLFETRGKSQEGIDLLAVGSDGRAIGIQCKQRNATRPVSVAEAEADLSRFRNFGIDLKAFVIATTHRKKSLQKWAAKNSSAGFEVKAYSWGDIEGVLRTDSAMRMELFGNPELEVVRADLARFASRSIKPALKWIERRCEEFSRGAERGELMARIVGFGDPEVHPNDDVIGWDEPSERAGTTWIADWRWPIGRPLQGKPPFWYVNNKRVTNVDSVHPKPWAWTDPDNSDGESGLIALFGETRALARYAELAGATWRDCCSSLQDFPEPVRQLIARHEIVQSPGGDEYFWTMFLFLVAWSGVGPKSLVSRRKTWIPGMPGMQFDAGIQDISEFIRSSPFLTRSIGGQLSELPRSWKHFHAELRPGLLTASADLCGWLSEMIDHGPNGNVGVMR